MKQLYFLILLFGLTMTIVSCSEDEQQPVITGVRLTDPTKADSLFTDAQRGQMCVLVGQHLGGATQLYINNQSVSFNPVYNTDHSLIFSIPGTLTLYGEDQTLPNEIRLVTAGGVATYAFHVLSPVPVISYYKVSLTQLPDGTYGVSPGQPLTIYGENFYEVEHVYLSTTDPTDDGGGTGETFAMQSFTVNSDYTEIAVTMPATIPEEAYIVVETYQGLAAYGFSSRIPAPELIDISSDMPIPGQTVTLYGRNLLEVLSLDICGTVLDADDLTLADDQGSLTFTMPALPSAGGNITLTTLGGTATLAGFCAYDHLITDFDDHATGWYSWGGEDIHGVSESDGAPALHSGNYAGVEGKIGSQWWWGNTYYGGIQYPSAIDGSTATADLELRFECYYAVEPNGVQFNLKLCDLETGSIDLTDRISGTQPVGQWFTVAIPLTTLTSAATYSDFVAKNDGNLNLNTRSSEAMLAQYFAAYFDNFRIIKK